MDTKSKFSFSLVNQCLLIIGSMLVMQTSLAQDAAGKVVFAQGQPTAISTAGAERGLSRGNEIFSGDRLVTTNGRLQISMVDGAFISVQPNSEYQVENYNYSGTPDGSEIANYRLVKGGVRAVTGLIGRQNPEAYKVNTAVGAIGIRGTGHNTRICAGDCGSRPDGLYHQTWEGITFVVNDVDSQDVPTGMGVFVADIDTDIEVLDQPSAVLAVDTTRERQEEELEEVEEETTVVSAGEQRDESGDQVIVSQDRRSVASTVLNNFGILGVLPDAESDSGEDVAIFTFETDSALFRRDSDDVVVGLIGFEPDDTGVDEVLTLATVDVSAIRGNDSARGNTANNILNAADPSLIATLEENPATVAESFFNGEVGFARWSDGRVLVLHDVNNDPADNEDEVFELTNFQSIHFLFGTDPSSLPISGDAFYDFIEGTSSTSFSGDTIGDDGVLGGNISVDFGTSSAFLEMDVDHDNINYAVSGPLSLGSLDGDLFDTDGVIATSTGGACDASCQTFIDGSFAGPALEGFPKYIGLEYDIQALDVIMGVALFGFESPPEEPAVPLSTVLTNSVFIGVAPDLELGGTDIIAGSQVENYNYSGTPDGSEIANHRLVDASLFISDNQVVGVLFTEEDDGPSPETFRVVATVDVDKVLGGDDTAAVSEVQTLLDTADSATVAVFDANTPASIADSFFDASAEFGWGRWTNGYILSHDDGPDTAADNFTGNQSVHFIYGQDPGTIATTGSASYNFSGGTQSTTESGIGLGNGVTAGSISIDFTGSGSINMTVDHIPSFPYTVSGSLNVFPANNEIFDNFVTAITMDPGSLCYSSGCPAFIDGGFAGPTNSGVPDHIGISYVIPETDEVMGVAGFGIIVP